jgi:hypothetical protein
MMLPFIVSASTPYPGRKASKARRGSSAILGQLIRRSNVYHSVNALSTNFSGPLHEMTAALSCPESNAIALSGCEMAGWTSVDVRHSSGRSPALHSTPLTTLPSQLPQQALSSRSCRFRQMHLNEFQYPTSSIPNGHCRYQSFIRSADRDNRTCRRDLIWLLRPQHRDCHFMIKTSSVKPTTAATELTSTLSPVDTGTRRQSRHHMYWYFVQCLEPARNSISVSGKINCPHEVNHVSCQHQCACRLGSQAPNRKGVPNPPHLHTNSYKLISHYPAVGAIYRS